MITRVGDALLGVSIGIAGAYLCFSYNELGYVTKDHFVWAGMILLAGLALHEIVGAAAGEA